MRPNRNNNQRTRHSICSACVVRGVVAVFVVFLSTPASIVAQPTRGDAPRTADLPDSWLVVYNTSDPQSVEWAIWYQALWMIPESNMFGAPMSLNEHLATHSDALNEVLNPVRDYLTNNPEVHDKIMGILVGFGVPGNYATPPGNGPGGFSIADALKDLSDDDEPLSQQRDYNGLFNPQFTVPPTSIPTSGRITKAALPPWHFMTARIDAPTLEIAKYMSLRAKALSTGNITLFGENVYFDFIDIPALPFDEWEWLRYATQSDELQELPWVEFESDLDSTPNAAFRFGTHDTVNWNNGRLYDGVGGNKVLAFNYNSWGATTVRSTTAQGGRYVPNALTAGYAASIGATGEPFCCLGPMPEVLLAALQENWTIAEAYYVSSVFDDWMWTLFADPFLRIPAWFDEEIQNVLVGDSNGDGTVDGRDINRFLTDYITSNGLAGDWGGSDLNGDGYLNDDDAFLFMAPLLYSGEDPGEVLRGKGDIDGNGVLNGEDLRLFVRLVIDGDDGASLRARWNADANKDGVVDLADIELFARRMVGRPCDKRAQPAMAVQTVDSPG